MLRQRDSISVMWQEHISSLVHWSRDTTRPQIKHCYWFAQLIYPHNSTTHHQTLSKYSFNDNHNYQFVNSMHEVMVHTICTAVWVVTLKEHKVCGFNGDFVVSEMFIHLHIKPSSGWSVYPVHYIPLGTC